MSNLSPVIFDQITQPLAAINYTYGKTISMILMSTNPTPDTSWTGYSLRSVIPLAKLTNPGFNAGFIRVRFSLASTAVSANLDAAYVGAGIASPNYNFDGSQVQLKFGGLTHAGPLTGTNIFTSDFVPFTFNFSTAISLIISTHWSGITVDTTSNTAAGYVGKYLSQAVGTEGSTAPSGSWGTDNGLTFITAIEFASNTGAFTVGDTITEYNAINSVLGVGTVLSVSNIVGANATLFVAPLSGNLQSNVIFFNQGNSVTANTSLYTDRTATGKLLQVPTTMTLNYTSANGMFSVGGSVYELDASGTEVVNGIISAVTLETLTLVNCSTVFWSNTLVIERTTGVAASVLSLSLSVGLSTNSSFTNLPGNWCFDTPNFFTSANVLATSTGFGATFRIGSLNNTELVSLNTDIILTYQNVILNAVNYGAALHNANSATTLLAALNYTSYTLGSIASLTAINPGINYSFAPIVYIYEPLTIDYYEADFVFYISQANGIFQIGESISQPNVGAVGIVKSADINSIRVRRIQFETQWLANNHIHDSSYLLLGASSGAQANLDSFISDSTAPTIGENAFVSTKTVIANGAVTGLEVLSSGFCFNQGDIATFASADGLRTGSAFAVLNNQGISPGYYRDRKGWVSADQKLLDSYYWQQYSYDVQSAISPNLYEPMLKSLLHIAGKIHFSSIIRQSLAAGNSGITSSTVLTINVDGSIELDFTRSRHSQYVPNL